MANLIDEFLIAIGLDAESLQKGLTQVSAEVDKTLKDADAGLSKVGEAGSAAGSAAAMALDKGAAAAADIGAAAQDAAGKIEDSFGGLRSVFDMVREKLGAIAGTFALITGGAEAFNNYIEQSDALSKLSTQLGVSVEELDAFGKAAEAAGGSAESVFASMQAYFEQTGRPAEEVFQLASKVEGMSRGAAQRFLQAQGIAADAVPIFVNGQKALDDLMAKYRKTAFTTQDAKTARAFKVAWMDFKTAAQDVGNVFVRGVAPALTKVLDLLTAFISFIRDNVRVFALMAAGMALVFGAKNIDQIREAVKAVKAFGLALKASALPVIALGAAIAALALTIDDLIGFAEGADSLFGRMLKNFGMTDEEIESLRESIKSIIDAFGGLWDAVKPFLGGVLTGIFKGLANVFGIIVGALALLVAGIAKAIGFCKRLYDAFPSAEEMADGFAKLKDYISLALDDAWAAIESWFSEWGAAIEKNVKEPLLSAFDGIGDALSSAFDSAWSMVTVWFGKWKDLIFESIASPIKDAFSGIGNFFGFGDDEEKKAAPSIIPDQRARERVAANVGLMQASHPVSNTNTVMNLTNNITTRDNPKAIASAVGGTVSPAFTRASSLMGHAVSGTNLK